MKKTDDLIGTATELVGEARQVQRCTGTFRGDLPDPRFRFNILFVQHDEDFPLHGHEYSELVLVLEGTATHRTDLEDYPIAAGDVFVINQPRRHGFQAARRLKLCNIQYDPRQFLTGHREFEKMMGYHALFDLEPRWVQRPEFRGRLRLTPSQRAHVQGLARTMSEEFQGRAEGRETMIRSAFVQLATYLSRLYTDARKKEPTPVARMANAVAYTRTHYRKPLRVEELARITHLSPSQFQRVFKKTYHTTPIRLINQIRIDEACELLKDPRHDIAAVAQETGFASASFFSTQFKRFTGMSPSGYRKKALNGSENGES